MATKKEEFLRSFDLLYDEVEVCVKLPDCPVAETIINPMCNFKAKKAYYDKAYNDALELIANTAIKITYYQFRCFEDDTEDDE